MTWVVCCHFFASAEGSVGAQVTGVDFKDLTHLPHFDQIDFRCGLFYEQNFNEQHFDLITMWHFLEHDYDPVRTLETARDLLSKKGRLIVEVPRLDSVSFRLFRNRWAGLQAPQHTVLYDRKMLLRVLEKAGLELIDYLPYGAFQPTSISSLALPSKFAKARGLTLPEPSTPILLVRSC